MRKMWMIVILALLALFVSGCANADYFDGTPSSEETVMTEPVQAIASQEHTTVFVSESTELSAESTAESAPPKASEPPPAAPTDPPTQIPRKPHQLPLCDLQFLLYFHALLLVLESL